MSQTPMFIFLGLWNRNRSWPQRFCTGDDEWEG